MLQSVRSAGQIKLLVVTESNDTEILAGWERGDHKTKSSFTKNDVELILR
jgi:hypothetical protein